MTLTKSDIVEKIAETTGTTKRNALANFEEVVAIIKETLQAGEKVKINGFGVFDVKQKADRLGRNPLTGETLTVEARKIVTFKTSELVRNAINGVIE